MRVLLVSHTFLPKYMGGTEVCVLESAKELLRRGHEVAVFCSDPLSGIEDDEYTISKDKIENFTVFTVQKNLRNLQHFEETYYDKKIIPFFEEVLRTFRPDVIHYHHLMHLSLECIDVAKTQGIPQLLTLHDFWFQTMVFNRVKKNGELYTKYSAEEEVDFIVSELHGGTMESVPRDIKYIRQGFAKLLRKTYGEIARQLNRDMYRKVVQDRETRMRQALRTVDAVLFPTLFLFQELCEWGFDAKKIVFMEDGINTELFKSFKKSESKKVRFGFIGSIIPAKGLDVLIQAWEKASPKQSQLKIYGSLELDASYAQKIKQLSKNVKNIEFCGTFPAEKIAEVYKGIDVLVIPSRWYENAPLVLRNAFLSKTPVIVTNLGSLSELVIPKKNGFLFENENINALSQIIADIDDNPAILNETKEFPSLLSIKEQISQLLKLYSSYNK